tara:strand:+ start:141150 stop:142397 length:1248 start_codon:yes stop_codon:yes gene_type:complete
MPLVTEEEAVEPIAQEQPLRPRETPKNYQDNVVDTKEVDHSSLLTYVSGSSWTVNYYSQILGKDQVGVTQQVDQNGVYQQYKEIKNFELKVQSSLSQDQDPETKVFEVVGTSNLYPSIIANTGDMFIADVGDGRSAIFTVTSTRRLTIYREAGFEINYKLVNYTTAERMTDLIGKVVESVFFNKEGLRKGANAFETASELVERQSVAELIERLTGSYTRRFWCDEFNTIVFRNENDDRIYDPFLVDFMKKLDVPWVKIPTSLNCNGIESLDEPTIWTTMVEGNTWFPDLIEWMEEVYPSTLSQLPTMGGIAWTTMELVRVPMVGKLPAEPVPPVPVDADYHPTDLEKHYVLSSWYYNKQPDGMSKLERYLSMWFENKSLDTTEIIRLAKEAPTWDTLSQFYQIPIILTLLLSLER